MSGPYYVISRIDEHSSAVLSAACKTEQQATKYARDFVSSYHDGTAEVVGVTAVLSAEVQIKVVRR